MKGRTAAIGYRLSAVSYGKVLIRALCPLCSLWRRGPWCCSHQCYQCNQWSDVAVRRIAKRTLLRRGYGGQPANGSFQLSVTATEPSLSVPSVFPPEAGKLCGIVGRCARLQNEPRSPQAVYAQMVRRFVSYQCHPCNPRQPTAGKRGPMWPYAVLRNEPSFAPRQARGYGGQAPKWQQSAISYRQSATATEPSVSVPSVFSVASVASRMPRRLQIAKRIQFLRRPCPAMSYDRFRR